MKNYNPDNFTIRENILIQILSIPDRGGKTFEQIAKDEGSAKHIELIYKAIGLFTTKQEIEITEKKVSNEDLEKEYQEINELLGKK